MKISSIRPHPRTWLAVVCTLALLSCGGGSGSGFDFGNTIPENNTPSTAQASALELRDSFAATLSGGQEVPQRQSNALGAGTVVVEPVTRSMIATLSTSGISGTAAHIHQGATGINGPIIFPLTETSPGSGIWTARATLTEAQFNTLRAGDYYFNVHSAAFPDGEIRGQITSQEATGTGATGSGAGVNTVIAPLTTYMSALRGAQEVPPNASVATGAGTLVTTPSTREIKAAVVTTGITGTAAHIHQGALGVNGPIIVPLVESVPGSGIWTGAATLTDAQYNSLAAGNLYFNVHSAAFPDGEIRGQIVTQRQTIANSLGPFPDSTAPGASGSGTDTGSGMGTPIGGTPSTPFGYTQ